MDFKKLVKRKPLFSYITYIALFALCIVLDQLTKFWAVRDLMPIGSTVVIEKVLGLRYRENTGAAFGMLEGQRWLFISLSSVAVVAILIYLVVQRKSVPPLLGVAFAMIAGGGIGNQIDRIRSGYVVDFFEFLFVDFAIFNVADCFVTVGAALVLLDLIFIDRDFLSDTPKKKAVAATASSEDTTDTPPTETPYD